MYTIWVSLNICISFIVFISHSYLTLIEDFNLMMYIQNRKGHDVFSLAHWGRKVKEPNTPFWRTTKVKKGNGRTSFKLGVTVWKEKKTKTKVMKCCLPSHHLSLQHQSHMLTDWATLNRTQAYEKQSASAVITASSVKPSTYPEVRLLWATAG